ncbi:NAD(P)-binding domain-containing protein [Streptomyces oryzae]|uniref:NAD(P)-binding domain-containing protein n=1 Tax=Streptomyces oryzae TaxID=1434886 RepID=A0ABS3X428_9ACTN|nr:NAD(P)-binding domain-containing protein [Streptomyces oryzae]
MTGSRSTAACDQVPLLLLSEDDLVASGLWNRTAEITDLVGRILCSPQEGWYSKAAVAPTNEEAAEFLRIPDETRSLYEGVTFDYKLNVLTALSRNGAGFKAIGANTLNHQQGLPRACALYVLYDRLTARPRTIIRSTLLSALRTAACACVVRDLCEARVVGVLGSGHIASTLVRLWAMQDRSELQEVRIYSPHLDAEKLRAAVGPTPYPLLDAHSAREAVTGADMLVTATTATRPVFSSSWVAPDAVQVNFGGYEAPLDFVDRCFHSGSVIVDTLEGTLHRGGQSLSLWWAGQDTPPATDRIQDFAAADRSRLDRPWHVNCVGRPDLDVALAQWSESLAREAGRGRTVAL